MNDVNERSSKKKSVVVDRAGFRLNVGILLCNQADCVFWGRRIGQDTWQFPQGGLKPRETLQQAMFRELNEEVGLHEKDVAVLGCSQHWISYTLPQRYIRHQTKPLVIGQKQKWFLLRLLCPQEKIRLNLSHSPEFDSWRWVDYQYPVDQVIYFKREVYHRALSELKPLLTDPVPEQHEDEG